MTIPTLMHKINNKVLENQFKKSYANLQNAFRATVNDDYMPFVLNSATGRDVDNNPEFGQQLVSKYKSARKLKNTDYTTFKKNFKTYTKKPVKSTLNCSHSFEVGRISYELADGSAISIMQNCHALWITLDTNGLKNKPNALGHDIFIFRAAIDSTTLGASVGEYEQPLDEDGNLIEDVSKQINYTDQCSLVSQSNTNGATCSKFVLKNKCPYDSSKTYWQCLP